MAELSIKPEVSTTATPATEGLHDAALSSDDHQDPHKGEFLSDEEGEEEEDEAAIKPWDEGGQSDCGYHDVVHSTLMSVGEKVHKVVGSPGKGISQVQHSIGNWFQELSYAARDIVRGENSEEMQQDAADAVSELMSGGKAKDEENIEDHGAAQESEQIEEKKEEHQTTL